MVVDIADGDSSHINYFGTELAISETGYRIIGLNIVIS
jgi:hypothetical protein